MSNSESRATLMGLGAAAYVGETVGHELVGHGSVCLLQGGKITALAPLFMRCSIHTIPMVLAGPSCNFLAAGVCALLLRIRTLPGVLSYFFWLSCGFNLLVACGYLIVGGVSTFGDWGVVFASTSPQGLWRGVLFAVGAVGYYYGLKVLGRLYAGMAGRGGFDRAVLQRRTLLPGVAAAAVACAAQIASGQLTSATLALTLGCTVFVGWSLSRMGDVKLAAGSPLGEPLFIPLSVGWLVVCAIVTVLFVVLVGWSASSTV